MGGWGGGGVGMMSSRRLGVEGRLTHYAGQLRLRDLVKRELEFVMEDVSTS
jgi:hypothetical protein